MKAFAACEVISQCLITVMELLCILLFLFAANFILLHGLSFFVFACCELVYIRIEEC